MEKINIKKIYPYSTISQDKGWKALSEKVREKYGNQEILINFDGIDIVSPCRLNEFCNFLKNTNVHLEFTNKGEEVNNIRMLCILENINEDRVHNIEVEVKKVETASEKKIRLKAEDLIGVTDIDNGLATINVYKLYTQLGSNDTSNYIRKAIEIIHENNKCDNFVVECKSIFIIEKVLDELTSMEVEFKKHDINIDVHSDIDEYTKKLGLFTHMKMNKMYSLSDRIHEIKKLKNNTPGLLVKYKRSRALDSFGRYGKGEVVSSRIALFKELREVENELKAVFWSYNSNYFYTNESWAVEHDGEALLREEKAPSEIEVGMDELGLYDKFIGSKYHFLMPIQSSNSESISMIEVSQDGTVLRKRMTIPERMKAVFDDWNVKYDSDSLDEYIKETQEHLKND